METSFLLAITVLLVEVVAPVRETLYPSSFNLLTTSCKTLPSLVPFRTSILIFEFDVVVELLEVEFVVEFVATLMCH